MFLDVNNLVDDFDNQRIFLGKYSGFQRYDRFRYKFFDTIEDKMRQSFWNPQEISLISDRIAFPDLPEHIQMIIKNNLNFQTLMDSAQSRALSQILLPHITIPEVEAAIFTQSFFELIHSKSYSWILLELFNADASSIFDQIGITPEIQHRIDSEISAYEALNQSLETKTDEETQKKIILDLCIRIFALEGLKFYVSFLVTYMINDAYNSSIQGLTKIIKLINFDENMHVSLFSGLLGILKKNKIEGFQELFTSGWMEERAISIFEDVANSEMKWAKYLMSIGEIPGLTEEVFQSFIDYYKANRLKRLHIKTDYNKETPEIVKWFEHYSDINTSNIAGQETESLSYNLFTMKNDLQDSSISLNL